MDTVSDVDGTSCAARRAPIRYLSLIGTAIKAEDGS